MPVLLEAARSHPFIEHGELCRSRKDLVGHRVALANQLRAHLQICFPGAVGLFRDLDSPISLRFLTRFDLNLNDSPPG